MEISDEGMLALIAHEGIELCCYLDQANVPTIGIGHTHHAGMPIPKLGMKIAIEDALQIFIKDLQKYQNEVLQKITIPLKQHEFDALVSWHYNMGRINNSTLTTKLLEGDKLGAAAQFKRWNKYTKNGVKHVSKGLTTRRLKEEKMFSEADYGNDKIAVRFTPKGKHQAWTKADMLPLLQNSKHALKIEDAQEDQNNNNKHNPNSKLLPSKRPQLKSNDCRATLRHFKHLVPKHRRNDEIFILAIRGYFENSMGKLGVNDRGIYDDAIFVIEPSQIHRFNANTDPSIFRPKVAKLKTKQAVLYHPGLHGHKQKNGPYPAFRQKSPVTVIRDNQGEDRDHKSAFFWLNLHRGGINSTSSLGCQTVPNHQWDEFKSTIDDLLKEYKQKDFYYILIDEEDIIHTPKNLKETTAMSDNKELNKKQFINAFTEAFVSFQNNKNITNESSDIFQNVPSDIAQQLIEKMQENGILKIKKELTPVNAVFGKKIGQLLDGKKTIIGLVGMLATTLIPGFSELIPILKTVLPIIHKTEAITTPLLSGTLLWGVLGKVQKWIDQEDL